MNDRDRLDREIRHELRETIDNIAIAAGPLSSFVDVVGRGEQRPGYYVAFDNRPPPNVQGLIAGVKGPLTWPDLRIINATHSSAQGLWHLKDRIKKWVGLNGLGISVEQWVKQHLVLQICGDIANQKKHGLKNDWSHSGLWPRLDDVVTIDLRASGTIELAFEGDRKRGTLFVSKPTPIPVALGIYIGVGEKQMYPEPASLVLRRAIRCWLPLLQQVGILTGADPELTAIEHDITAVAVC